MATSADIQSYNSDLDAFEQYHQQREEPDGISPTLPALGHGLAGGVGAAASNVVIYPLNLMITRAQTAQRKGGTGEKESILEAARKIYDKDGLAGLYAGCAIDTTKTMIDSFLFFMAYNAARQQRLKAHGGRKHLPVVDELGVGFVAGVLSKFFTAPLSNVVTRLQTAKDKSTTIASIVDEIRQEKGITGLWTGYSATFVTTLNPSLTFFFFEFLKTATLHKDKRASPPAWATFLLSALSKSAASAATYPFSLAKSRAQTRKSEPTDPEKATDSLDAAVHQAKLAAESSIFGIVAQIARDDGLSALYQGVELEVLKGFLSHGLTMVLKERAHKLIIQLYFLLLKAFKRYPSPKQLAQRVLPDAGSANEFATSMFDEVKDRTETMVEKAADASQSAVDGMGEWMKDYIGDDSNGHGSGKK